MSTDSVFSHRLFLLEDAEETQSWAYLDYNRATKRAVAVRMLNQTQASFSLVIQVDGEADMQMSCPAGTEGNQPLDFPVTISAKRPRLSGFTWAAMVGLSG